MWRLLFVVAIAFGGIQTPDDLDKTASIIVGGVEVKIEKIPYQLALESYKGTSFCGASIISEYWALTAAHCMFTSDPDYFRLRSGSSLKEEGGRLHQVVEIIKHDDYNSTTDDYDVAVLRVYSSFNKKHIINLAKVRPVTGTNVSVSGWGKTEEGGHGSKHLQWAFVPIVDQKKCFSQYAAVNSSITDRMICAGLPQGGKDSCQGDSGGPLAIGNTQVGIVSKGIGCARKYPGVYTDVAALRSWILKKIGNVVD